MTDSGRSPAADADRASQKEAAVKERRHWVRLTRACNNRCLFCLDSDNLTGPRLRGEGPSESDSASGPLSVPDAEIEADIRRGRAEGADRLILSGGEASIHPRFVDFVRLGREVGYSWIQTISNGRMYSYGRFVRAAVQAGLNEATLSIHGHTAALHDGLTGIPGSFEQALAGLTNLRRVPGFVVSVDVVLNRRNVPHLAEILAFFIARGVTEFDLLHLVPFGRAWSEHRDELTYDPHEMREHLKRAFALRRRHDLVIWTNRLPAAHLEGEEDLIQDPHKLHDEVRGRMAMFEELAWRGTPFCCHDERCGQCPLDGLCSAFRQLVGWWRGGGAERVLLGAGTSAELLAEVSARFGPPSRLVLEVTDADAWPSTLPVADAAAELLYSGSDPARLAALAADGRPLLVRLSRPLTAAGSLPAGAAMLFPTFEYLSEVAASSPSFEQGRGALDLPRCLGGLGGSLWSTTFPLAVVDPETFRLDPVRFTDHYVRHLYRVHSLRCEACAARPGCPGLSINHVRHAGFGVLQPLAAER